MTAYLPPVKPGDPFSARAENARIDAINSITARLNTLYTPPTRSGGIQCTVYNNTSNNIPTGGVLEVYGARQEGDKDKMLALYRSSGLQLIGNAVDAKARVIAFALEGIPHGGIGRCYVPGVIGALVTVVNAGHAYATVTAGGLKTSPFGEFEIVERSTETSGTAFALLVPVNLGHLIGTTQAVITGATGSANVRVKNEAGDSVTLEGVKCPLLRGSETIASGSVVVLSWNTIERKYEIIEAQCPAS